MSRRRLGAPRPAFLHSPDEEEAGVPARRAGGTRDAEANAITLRVQHNQQVSAAGLVQLPGLPRAGPPTRCAVLAQTPPTNVGEGRSGPARASRTTCPGDVWGRANCADVRFSRTSRN